MNFASYQDFRVKLHMLLDGDDISQSDLSVNVLDTLIGMGETRIYRDIRSSTQDTAFSVSVSNNVATLPADFLEMRGAPNIGGYVTATYVPWEVLTNVSALDPRSATHPVRYTFAGDTMIFYPFQDSVTVTGQYYRRFPDLITGLNPLFVRHPDVFMYASLAEAGPFLGETTRAPAWETKYSSLAEAANEQERRRVTRGSKLATRVG